MTDRAEQYDLASRYAGELYTIPTAKRWAHGDIPGITDAQTGKLLHAMPRVIRVRYKQVNPNTKVYATYDWGDGRDLVTALSGSFYEVLNREGKHTHSVSGAAWETRHWMIDPAGEARLAKTPGTISHWTPVHRVRRYQITQRGILAARIGAGRDEQVTLALLSGDAVFVYPDGGIVVRAAEHATLQGVYYTDERVKEYQLGLMTDRVFAGWNLERARYMYDRIRSPRDIRKR